MQDQSSEVFVSPSFSSYSSDSLADIATKVCREFGKFNLDTSGGDAPPPEEDEDFEFVSLTTSRDEIFLNGAQIGPVFPVFNRDLLLGNCKQEEEEEHRRDGSGLRDGDEEEGVQDPPSSSSSSEADELDGIPPGTYCVWTPKGSVPPSPARCQKSKSTGSSSRGWRFRDLLRRSHSDGKESFVFLTPSFGSRKSTTTPSEENKVSKVEEIKPIGHNRGSAISAASSSAAGGKGKNMAAAHEVFYVKNRASKNQKVEKRRSTFLPYRQDLVGFFANVNGMGRTFPPF